MTSRVFNFAFAFFLLVMDGVAHIVWALLPFTFCERILKASFTKKPENPVYEYDAPELAEAAGYSLQEHFAAIKDGYILGVHRVMRKGTDVLPESAEEGPKRGVVFLMHGFMQNSECWLASGTKNTKRSLPYNLVDAGYDVWLGNNRGNKYSHKHLHLSPNDKKFWDFCIDDLALHDIPTMVEYALSYTGAPSLIFIGFSQGTAQAFASFSSNPELVAKIKLFIALAPCTRVHALPNQLVRSLTVQRPQMLFLFFGRRALLAETMFYRNTLPISVYVWLVEKSMRFLFGWTCQNIDDEEKDILYTHLYSYGSVKTLVHWFQITRTRRFQMFDGSVIANNFEKSYKPYILPSYSPKKITCPIALFYGGKDNLPDIDFLLGEIPPASFIHLEPTYEHLDFQWSRDAHIKIFPKIVELVRKYS